MPNNVSTVCVTGASGYLASWIVKQLLDEGHRVHGTVRDMNRKDKIEHLEAMQAQYPGQLHLFEADLLQPGSFKDALTGCDYVMHTASPFMIGKVKDPMNTLVKPALEGVKNVLESAKEVDSIQRVVLTSSVVAIMSDGIEAKDAPNQTLDEKAWNHVASLDYMPYHYSKKVAEEEAWKIAESQDQWDLVVINPGFILGPSLSKRSDGVSTNFMKTLTDGTMAAGIPAFYVALVDVRDVAQAHLKAAFVQEAQGRHILIGEVCTFVDFGKALMEEFGNAYKFPKNFMPKWLAWTVGPMFGLDRRNISRSANVPFNMDNSKSIKELGMSYRDKKETLVDQLNQMIEKGLIPAS